jgi:hypothetical protein
LIVTELVKQAFPNGKNDGSALTAFAAASDPSH